MPVLVRAGLAVLALALPLAAQTVVHDLEGANADGRFGNAVREAGDVDGDGVPDVIVGAPTDSSAGFKGGAAYVHSGADGSEIHAIQAGAGFSVFGSSVAGIGDLDGDGRGEFVVGQSFARGSGQVHAFSGDDASLLWTIPGLTFDDAFGTAIDVVGDVDRDGTADLAVGAPWDKQTIWFAGAVRVYSGATRVLLHDWFGDAGGDNLGAPVRAAGDVNDDGWPDVIAGAPGASVNGVASGLARVWSGADGSVLHTWLGASADDEYGAAVDGAGDVDGDGHDDLVIGAYFADAGIGDGTGTAEVRSGRTGAVIHTWTGVAAGDWFGLDVAGAGDVDGDGYADLLVGASNADAGNGATGTATLYSGATGAPLLVLEGDDVGDDFGLGLSTAGDLDGDGYPEFIVGAPRATTTVSVGGRARVVSYDGPKGPWAILGGGLGGTTLPARLRGLGTLVGGEPVRFELDGAPFGAATYIVAGFAELNAPFKQGVLVPDPSPPALVIAVATDGTGSLTFGGLWIAGVPSGFELFVQTWSVDPNGPAGFSASNAVRATAP